MLLVPQKEPYVMFRHIPPDGIPLVADENLEGFCIDLARAVAKEVISREARDHTCNVCI